MRMAKMARNGVPKQAQMYGWRGIFLTVELFLST